MPMTPTGESFGIVQKALGPQYPKGVRAFSPLLAYKKGMPPVFFIQGEQDPWVPKVHTTEEAARLKALGIRSEVLLVPHMGHGLKLRNEEEAKAWDRFADWTLKELGRPGILTP